MARNTSQGRRLFKKFIESHGIEIKDAAAGLGVARQSIWSWLSGKSVPFEGARQAIETWTRGAVPASAWGPATDKRSGRTKIVPYEPKANAAN